MDRYDENQTINWYPGHMHKTKNEIKSTLNMVDLILEIIDARIPSSSSNSDLKDIIKNKEKIIILNKSDLADEEQNKKWIKYFREKEKTSAILVNALENKSIENIKKEILNLKVVKEKIDLQKQKGIENPSINIMIVGIPNVGKSTILNKMIKKSSQSVKNKPGETKKNQWFRTRENINILDTPGLLWPKLEGNSGMFLASVGSVKRELIDSIEVACFIIKKIIEKKYTEYLEERYNLKDKFAYNLNLAIKIDDDIKKCKNELKQNKSEELSYKLEDLYFMYNINVYNVFNDIGKKRGFLRKGNSIDEEKTADVIINEFQKGNIGRITLEHLDRED